MYTMDNFNLLDLDNDVLNIIGDYVKEDNHDRLQKYVKNMFSYIKIQIEKKNQKG